MAMEDGPVNRSREKKNRRRTTSLLNFPSCSSQKKFSNNSVTSHTQISDLFEGLILRSHPIGSKSKCNRVSQPPGRLWYSITLGLWPRCLLINVEVPLISRSPTKLHAPWMFSHSKALFKNDCTSTAYWYLLQHHEHKHENLELWRY